MDIVKYLSNDTTTQNGKYPVTIQGLDFIQKQLLQLQNTTRAGGEMYLLKNPTVEAMGYAVIDGEILPVSNRTTDATHIIIETTKQTIRTDAGDYESREVRVGRWVVHPNYNPNTGEFADFEDNQYKPLIKMREFKTNVELWKQLSAVMATQSNCFRMESGVYTLEQLNSKRTTLRLNCLAGSYEIGGRKSYIIDVYTTAEGAYQELTTVDLRKFGRSYANATLTWSDWVALDGYYNVEAKALNGGKDIFIRHSFLPPYVNIVLLRKRKRNKHKGAEKPFRKSKRCWMHFNKIVLTKSALPNKWYIPKCASCEMPIESINSYNGLELSALLQKSLVKHLPADKGVWRLRGVDLPWKKTRTGYAKIAIGIVVGTQRHNMTTTAMSCIKAHIFKSQDLQTYNFSMSVD